MRTRDVVTCFVQHGDRVLVLKRSQKVRTHRGKWAAVSGSVDLRSPLLQAFRELEEETGLTRGDVQVVRRAEPLDVPDDENDTLWRVHPFLVRVKKAPDIRLNWEHTEYKWVDPDVLATLDAVPSLKETWDLLWKPSNLE